MQGFVRLAWCEDVQVQREQSAALPSSAVLGDVGISTVHTAGSRRKRRNEPGPFSLALKGAKELRTAASAECPRLLSQVPLTSPLHAFL